MSYNQNIEELIAGYCEGSLSEKEAAELHELIRTDAEAMELFRQARDADKIIKTLSITGDEAGAWRKIEEGMRLSGQGRRSRNRSRSVWRYAAGVAAVMVLGAVTYFAMDRFGRDAGDMSDHMASGSTKAILQLPGGGIVNLGEESGSATFDTPLPADSLTRLLAAGTEELPGNATYGSISVPRGGQYAFHLPDGSKVYLNSESEIRFPAEFSGAQREVSIRGEVFFDVTPDAEHPFIVHANGSAIKVLGTRFNVSAYPDDHRVVTTLLSGSVKFNASSYDDVLAPGEQTVWGADNDMFVKRKVDTALYTSWIEGRFEFEKMPLSEITRQFARWYDVDFSFGDHELGDLLFTGVSQRSDDLSIILDAIAKTTNIEFKLNGKEIIITKKDRN